MTVKEMLQEIVKNNREIKAFIKNSNSLENRISRFYHIKVPRNGSIILPTEFKKLLWYELETETLFFDMYMTPERYVVLVPTIETEDSIEERIKQKRELQKEEKLREKERLAQLEKEMLGGEENK